MKSGILQSFAVFGVVALLIAGGESGESSAATPDGAPACQYQKQLTVTTSCSAPCTVINNWTASSGSPYVMYSAYENNLCPAPAGQSCGGYTTFTGCNTTID